MRSTRLEFRSRRPDLRSKEEEEERRGPLSILNNKYFIVLCIDLDLDPQFEFKGNRVSLRSTFSLSLSLFFNVLHLHLFILTFFHGIRASKLLRFILLYSILFTSANL